MEEPEDKERFNKHMVDDIKVYIPKNLQTQNSEITIKYWKFLWMERLIVTGIEIDPRKM